MYVRTYLDRTNVRDDVTNQAWMRAQTGRLLTNVRARMHACMHATSTRERRRTRNASREQEAGG